MSIELLKAARDLIADPVNHTRFAYARDEDGAPLMVGSEPEAASWCAVGALQALAWCRRDRHEAMDALSRAAKDVYAQPRVTIVNDDHGHEATLKVYDRAIEMAA